MTYPHLSPSVDETAGTGENPFEMSLEAVVYALNALAQDYHLYPLQKLLDKPFADLDELKAMITDLEDRQLSKRILVEIDIIVDDYRRSIALL